jgi:glycosyltransferase involved in cell wall biosynthesis
MKFGPNIVYIRTDIEKEALQSGGSVAHTLGVVRGLCAQGYSVICISSVMTDILSREPVADCIKLTVPSWVRFLRWRLTCLLSNFFFTYQIFVALKGCKPDALYQRYAIFNCSGLIIRFIKNIPLVLEYNGSEAWIDKHWSKRSFIKLNFIARCIEWIHIRCADHIVVVSHALYQELVDRGVDKKKILVNPNGVDTHVYNPAVLVHERDEVRAKLGIEKCFVVGFIGTFSQWHGITKLARIIPQACKLEPRLHFLIIGYGSLWSSFKQDMDQLGLTDRYVTITGEVKQQRARDYLAACDAFVCPTQPNPDGTDFFGSPTKLFEYMSLAKPLLASDLGQLSEIVSPGLYAHNIVPSLSEDHPYVGILVPPSDQDAWVSSIWAVAQMSSTVHKRFGVNARNKAMQEFDWKHHVRRISEFIDKEV